MEIRKARQDELSALARIAGAAQSFYGYPEDWVRSVQADFTLSEDLIVKNSVYVADEAGELVGFYALGKDRTVLADLQVAPTFFGTGVGKHLFLHAMERLRSPND